MCGEKVVVLHCKSFSQGSPPHVRGKEHDADIDRQAERITPACAGKSDFDLRYSIRFWDHPRMCGEKRVNARTCARVLGSPPHVRGKADKGLFVLLHYGITPACAGKSSVDFDLRYSIWDHPRMCGEKTKKIP